MVVSVCRMVMVWQIGRLSSVSGVFIAGGNVDPLISHDTDNVPQYTLPQPLIRR